MRDDFAWLTEHSRENYEKYAGRWIAVLDGEVVGVGETAVEAANQAEREHPSGDYILEKVERDVDVIYAGLRLAQGTDPSLRRTAHPVCVRGNPRRG
jgi:hypothetical protein